MVGDRIKALRERQVVGQAELARKAGIAINTLYLIEAGKVTPRKATVRAIAKALEVEPWELVDQPAAPAN